jgi:hypothetical protein
MYEVSRGYRGVRHGRPRRRYLHDVPSSARLRSTCEGGPLRDLPRDRDQAHFHERSPSQLRNVPWGQRSSREGGARVRDVPCGRAVERASWSSSLRGLPRASFRRTAKHSDVRVLPCARGGRQPRTRRGRMRHLPSRTWPRRGRHTSGLCELPRASQVAGATLRRRALELYDVPLVARSNARGSGHVHHELPRRPTQSSAGGAGLQRLSRLSTMKALRSSHRPSPRPTRSRRRPPRHRLLRPGFARRGRSCRFVAVWLRGCRVSRSLTPPFAGEELAAWSPRSCR